MFICGLIVGFIIGVYLMGAPFKVFARDKMTDRRQVLEAVNRYRLAIQECDILNDEIKYAKADIRLAKSIHEQLQDELSEKKNMINSAFTDMIKAIEKWDRPK